MSDLSTLGSLFLTNHSDADHHEITTNEQVGQDDDDWVLAQDLCFRGKQQQQTDLEIVNAAMKNTTMYSYDVTHHPCHVWDAFFLHL